MGFFFEEFEGQFIRAISWGGETKQGYIDSALHALHMKQTKIKVFSEKTLIHYLER